MKLNESPVSALVRVPFAADYLSMSRSGVYALMEAGRLPYVKIGNARRIALADLEALVRQCRVGPERKGD